MRDAFGKGEHAMNESTPEQRAAERICGYIDRIFGAHVTEQVERESLSSIIAAEFADERKAAKEKAELLDKAVLMILELQKQSEETLAKLKALAL